MDKTKRSPWIIVLVSGIVLVFFCLCGVVLGGGATFLLSESRIPQKVQINLGGGKESGREEAQSVPTKPVAQIVQPTKTIEKPALPAVEPTTINPVVVNQEDPSEDFELRGKQVSKDKYMFDDFSSNHFIWYVGESETESFKIKDESYYVHGKKAETQTYIFLPKMDFIPYEFSFDIRSTSDDQNGVLNIDCQQRNFLFRYYVEIDLGTGDYTIAKSNFGDITPLIPINSQGQYWKKANSFIKPPTTFNHIAVGCYLDSITLSINDVLVDRVNVKDPFPETGFVTLGITTNKQIPKDGYTVILDNFEAFQKDE